MTQDCCISALVLGHVLFTNTLFTSSRLSNFCLSHSVCIGSLNLPHLSEAVWWVTLLLLLLSVWALLLLILLSVPRHRIQLWPSQGALAGSHLTGPWPQDDGQHQHVPYMRDKATQVSARDATSSLKTAGIFGTLSYACADNVCRMYVYGAVSQCTEVKGIIMQTQVRVE